MRAILMFHGVDETGSVLSISVRQLASLIEVIRDSGHTIVPLSDLLDGRGGGRAVAFTFDDGFSSVFSHAAPLFRAESVPATLFLTVGHVGRDNQWPSQPADSPRFELMSWDEVEMLVADGWSIDAHSVTHPDLRLLPDDALAEEIERPIEILKQYLGRKSEVLAYPYGYYDQRVLDATRKHYRYAVTTEMRELADDDAPLRLPRIDTYYLRSPWVHRGFGSHALTGYLLARRTARRWTRHPGEIR